MRNRIKEFYKNNLVYSTKEKLSKLTILLIIVLNIIVFNILIDGINFQNKFVSNPNKIYANSCLNIIDSDLKLFNSFYYDKNYNLKEDYLYKLNLQENDYKKLDLRCINIGSKLKIVHKFFDVKNLINKDKELRKKEEELENKIRYIDRNYDTLLFQKIARQTNEKSILEDELNSENVKQKYEEYKKSLELIKAKKNSLKEEFINSYGVKELINYVESIKDSYYADEMKAYEYYFYKIEIATLLFLLPIVFLFLFLVKRFIKKERYILYIIFKNLFYVALIPTIINIFSFIYKFLPQIYIKKLILFFYNLEISFLVYYLLIIIFVIIFVLFIVKIQKRFKEKNEKLKRNKITMIKSYNKGNCNNCGNKVSYINMNYCPCCKNNLRSNCKSCNKSTISFLNYCEHCGEEL